MDATQDISISHLDWDSDFFNMKICRIDGMRFDVIPEETFRRLKAEGYKLAYVMIPYTNTVSLSDGVSTKPVDIKIVYSKLLTDRDKMADMPEIALCTKASDRLYDLAYQAGHMSRFRMDPNFEDTAFKRMYRAWIDNSVAGIIADYVFGYYEGQMPIGLLTLRIKDGVAEIGLIAVDEAARGKGLGRSLLQKACAMSYEKGATRITVATQKINKGACAFYESNGFSLDSSTAIYHEWM